MNLNTGSLLQGGQYKIEKVLGQGGFGITYLAEQTGLGRKVAIKEFFIKGGFERGNDSSAVSVSNSENIGFANHYKEKFLKEARSIAALEHKSIVPIYNVFEENGTAYYVMKYYSCGSLADKVRSGAMPEADAVRYIRQVASALSFVHSKSVMHLDIKPANILLGEEGGVVLIDFGLAKQYDSEGQQTSTTPVGVSHGYAPLEQYKRGGVSSFSPSTDVYSLGATLYKLVTGQVPPEASDVYDDGLPALPHEISPSVREAIETAMQPRRRDRPQSVGEFMEILGETEVTSMDFVRIPQVAPAEEDTCIGDFEIMPAVTVKKNGDGFLFNVNGIEFRMVFVDGGSFIMGEKRKWYDLNSDNKAHNVTLDSYCIGETEVTQELWTAVMNSNPSYFKGNNQRPVEMVSYNDCQEFIEKLNTLLAGQLPNGRRFRLPTEAEWEFAARGGNHSRGYRYSGSNNIGEVACFFQNSNNATCPVKKWTPNELGLYDMSGNVWEWCNDWYDGGYYDVSEKKNPQGPSSGSNRVLRGGSWYNITEGCHVALRSALIPMSSENLYGFRLAL